mgnify:CR=1 FL=1
MSTNALSYGLIPVFHPTGQGRANKYTILSTYAKNIFKGDLVKVGTNGTIEIGDGTTPCLGVFAGCEYIDAQGKPTVSPYWPTGTTATNIVAYVYDDQQTVFKTCVTANASGYDQTVVGQQCNFFDASTNNTSGNVNTGLSGGSVVTAAIAAATLAQLRIIGYVNGEVYNATTNPYPELLVQLAEVQFAPNAAGV